MGRRRSRKAQLQIVSQQWAVRVGIYMPDGTYLDEVMVDRITCSDERTATKIAEALALDQMPDKYAAVDGVMASAISAIRTDKKKEDTNNGVLPQWWKNMRQIEAPLLPAPAEDKAPTTFQPKFVFKKDFVCPVHTMCKTTVVLGDPDSSLGV